MSMEGLNGTEFMGRELTINEARPREERGGSNFRGKSGGFDRGRKNNNRDYQNRRDR